VALQAHLLHAAGCSAAVNYRCHSAAAAADYTCRTCDVHAHCICGDFADGHVLLPVLNLQRHLHIARLANTDARRHRHAIASTYRSVKQEWQA
jgi:hypothetical protein